MTARSRKQQFAAWAKQMRGDRSDGSFEFWTRARCVASYAAIRRAIARKVAA